MANIDLNTMKTWNDRDVMTAAQYDAERNKVITAINDNQAQITSLNQTISTTTSYPIAQTAATPNTLVTRDANGDIVVNAVSTAIPLAQVLSGGYKVQSGSGTMTGITANVQSIQSITFPSVFTSSPIVFVTMGSGLPNTNTAYIGAANETSSGFNVFFQTSSSASSMSFKWIAIGL